ncbi:MAG TPA: DUF4294 domain-containing protein [Sphingobacteriaceae bacterium]
MKNFGFLVIACVILASNAAFAQEMPDSTIKGKNDTIRVALTLVNGELIPWVALQEVVVTGRRKIRTPEEQAKFNRLRYNVLKVLPYASFARDRYARLNSDLARTTNKKERRALARDCEREIKEMFNREVKKLTISQGKILIKLIDRETGFTTYELAKEMKGGMNAFFYQSVARIFGHNLKEKYDPQQERDIESIIQTYGYGYYRYN